jgi:hypothetical protein
MLHLAALNSAFPGAAAKFPKATEHAVDAALDALAAWQANETTGPTSSENNRPSIS